MAELKISKSFKPPLQVFISYSREDKAMKSLLLQHLTALTESNRIRFWDDGQIAPGEKWDAIIKEQLLKSDIILFLISARAISSEYIQKVELKMAFEQHQDGNLIIIPVLINHVYLGQLPITQHQTLPKNGRCITDKTAFNTPDEGFMELARDFDALLDNLFSFNPPQQQDLDLTSIHQPILSKIMDPVIQKLEETLRMNVNKYLVNPLIYPRDLRVSHLHIFLGQNISAFEDLLSTVRAIHPNRSSFIKDLVKCLESGRTNCQKILELLKKSKCEDLNFYDLTQQTFDRMNTIQPQLLPLISPNSEQARLQLYYSEMLPLAFDLENMLEEIKSLSEKAKAALN